MFDIFLRRCIPINKNFFNESFNCKLKKAGWVKIDSGKTKDIDYNERCAIYVKKQKFAEILIPSAFDVPEKPCISTDSDTPSSDVMVHLKGEGVSHDCCSPSVFDPDNYLVNSNFVSDMRKSDSSLIIKADCFWFDNPSNIISYNLSVVVDDYVLTMIIFPFSDVIKSLTIDYMLGVLFDQLPVGRVDRRKYLIYKYIDSLNEKGEPVVKETKTASVAEEKAVYAFYEDKPSTYKISELSHTKKDKWLKYKTVANYSCAVPNPVTLLLNHGLIFLSSLDTKKSYSTNLLSKKNVEEWKHAIFTSKPIDFYFNSMHERGWDFIYSISLSIRDVVTHNCTNDDNISPETYGRFADCRVNDYTFTKFGENFKRVLHKFIEFSPEMYMKYATDLNVFVLMYMARIWGFNRHIPYTITSAACKVAKDRISDFLNCKSKKDYLSKYAGVQRLEGKLQKSTSEKFFRISTYYPLDDDCNCIQMHASESFRGGYNAYFSVDLHNGHTTYDIDIASAYPTAMAIVPAIDWANPVAECIHKRYLSIDDFIVDGKETPFSPVFAYVRYKFPDDCMYPNLPHSKESDDDAPCYPLEETDGVYCSGPELYIALKLGAEIFVINGYKANVLHDDDGEIVYPHRAIVCELVKERTEATKIYGKKSLQVKLLKLIVNSMYGKVSQNVRAMYEEKNQKRESEITNNAAASMITSFVRSVLIAAFVEIKNAGYEVYSATTDGLITDMPIEQFNELPLMGLRDYLLLSRKIMTEQENPEIWSVKHIQDDLLNLTTRGNASLIVENAEKGILGGVIAKAGISSKDPQKSKESIENRTAFYVDAISRNGKITSTIKSYTPKKDVAAGIPYTVSKRNEAISLDYDMKRKPIEESLCVVYKTIDGKTYEFAHFETEPFKDKSEYSLYRSVRKRHTCLRTVKQLKQFFNDINLQKSGYEPIPVDNEDYLWKIFCDCISGYKAGLWNIPYLDKAELTVAEKVEWIQSKNPCVNHKFNKKTWDKMSEKSRQSRILPIEKVQNVLNTLNTDEITDSVTDDIESVDETITDTSIDINNDDITDNVTDDIESVDETVTDTSIDIINDDIFDDPYIELLYKDYKNSAYFEDYVHDHMLLEESEKWDDE